MAQSYLCGGDSAKGVIAKIGWHYRHLPYGRTRNYTFGRLLKLVGI
jgi:hypothetical protein